MTTLPADLSARLAQLRQSRAPSTYTAWATSPNPELYAAFDCDDGALIGNIVSIDEHDVVSAAQKHRNRTGKYSLIQSCRPGAALSGNRRYPPRARRPGGANL